MTSNRSDWSSSQLWMDPRTWRERDSLRGGTRPGLDRHGAVGAISSIFRWADSFYRPKSRCQSAWFGTNTTLGLICRRSYFCGGLAAFSYTSLSLIFSPVLFFSLLHETPSCRRPASTTLHLLIPGRASLVTAQPLWRSNRPRGLQSPSTPSSPLDTGLDVRCHRLPKQTWDWSTCITPSKQLNCKGCSG